ncbi:hypothetical protein AAG570_003801 [Ranatra chinensis]|uniref:Uncharacterized protein n=1 Tax=Ranatra chinensis TaxID=642074 RepID=A0ABD0YH60_9HEMI
MTDSSEMTKKKGCSSFCGTLCVKPLSKENVLFYYGPAMGAASYAALSVNVMNPSLIMRIFPSRDVTNVLLLKSMVGSTLYMYNRPHLRSATTAARIMYSGYGAVMFNFGSVLLWAVLRSLMRPHQNCVATIIGLLSGCCLATMGVQYLSHIDSAVSSSPSPPPAIPSTSHK